MTSAEADPGTGNGEEVGAIKDASALGALRASQHAGRSECCVVMGQNAESRAELREQRTRFISSVAYSRNAMATI